MQVIKNIYLVLFLLLPTFAIAEDCNTSMKQSQAYGAISLDCAVGFLDHNNEYNTRKACAILTLPDGKGVIRAITEPELVQMSDLELAKKVCLKAAMKYAKMPE